MRLLELYRHTDAEMARALEERIGLAAIARAGGMDMTSGQARPAGTAQVRAPALQARLLRINEGRPSARPCLSSPTLG
jgi:hypothetical protein